MSRTISTPDTCNTCIYKTGTNFQCNHPENINIDVCTGEKLLAKTCKYLRYRGNIITLLFSGCGAAGLWHCKDESQRIPQYKSKYPLCVDCVYCRATRFDDSHIETECTHPNNILTDIVTERKSIDYDTKQLRESWFGGCGKKGKWFESNRKEKLAEKIKDYC